MTRTRKGIIAALLLTGAVVAQAKMGQSGGGGAVSVTSVTGTLPVANGGTGITSGTSGGILAYTGSGTLASSGALTASQLILGGGAGVAPSSLAAGSQYAVLVMGAANPGYGQVNLAQSAAITGTLPVANGGTGMTGQFYYEGKITGATISLGTSDNTTPHGVANGSLTLTDVIDASGATAAKIMCVSGTAASGSTCTAANESIGIAFTTGLAGFYRVCFNFTQAANIGAGGNVLQTWYVVQTGLSDETVSATGAFAGFGYFTSLGANSNISTICGSFGSLSASTSYGFRLFTKLTASGTITSNDFQNGDGFGEHASVTVERL